MRTARYSGMAVEVRALNRPWTYNSSRKATSAAKWAAVALASPHVLLDQAAQAQRQYDLCSSTGRKQPWQ